MRHTQFFWVGSVSETCILEVPHEIYSTFCGLFRLLNNSMYARFWSVFKVGEQVSIIFGFTDFWGSSRYFSSIVILINFYYVECGDGRQPRILVNNFWSPKHVFRFRVSHRRDRAVLLFFFRINTSLCFFSFQGKLISLTDIHVLHLASLCRICGDEIEDHKRKVDTNRFVSEIH